MATVLIMVLVLLLATVMAQVSINTPTRGAGINAVVTMIRAGTTVIATTSEGMAGIKATGDGNASFDRRLAEHSVSVRKHSVPFQRATRRRLAGAGPKAMRGHR